MLRYFAAALLGVFCLGTRPVLAEDCFPHCDFYHDYGPYVIGPSLYCYPRCGLNGNCSPFLKCKQQSHGIRKSHPATAFPERPRRSDLTEQPFCDGEVGPRGRAGIRAEAEPGLTISLGIVNAQRLD